MKWIVAPLLFVAANLSFAGDDAKNGGKKLVKELQGEWKIVSGQKNGEDVPDQLKDSVTVVFEGDKMFVRDASGANKDEMTFTIDPKAKPVSIDLEQKRESKKFEGILELKGDVLKLCIHQGAVASRPSEFAAPAGSEKVFAELKRVKK
jgi:uncharacterized protein (TIGR03067 family)